jgi:hypothetical protein
MLDTSVTWYRLDEVPLADLFGMHGIYVLWDACGEERPSYIGTGTLLTRLAGTFGAKAQGVIRDPTGTSEWLAPKETRR